MKHTPGPWSVSNKYGSKGAVAHASGFIAFPTMPREASEDRIDGESWLDMRTRTQPDRDAIDSEKEANARLIAAAPDMLQALKQMLDAFHHDPLGCGQDAAVEAALDAVAKAQGEK